MRRLGRRSAVHGSPKFLRLRSAGRAGPTRGSACRVLCRCCNVCFAVCSRTLAFTVDRKTKGSDIGRHVICRLTNSRCRCCKTSVPAHQLRAGSASRRRCRCSCRSPTSRRPAQAAVCRPAGRRRPRYATLPARWSESLPCCNGGPVCDSESRNGCQSPGHPSRSSVTARRRGPAEGLNAGPPNGQLEPDSDCGAQYPTGVRSA